MSKTRVAIIGSGNIGTDLMYKVSRSPLLELTWMCGIVPESEGLERARRLGIRTTDQGAGELLRHADDFEIAFDATTARAHVTHAQMLKSAGKIAIDLTPAAVGAYVVPEVNLTEHLHHDNVNLITCGGQATIPIVAAISRATHVTYAEIVSTVASRSAGPGTRKNIDEFTHTTGEGLVRIGGADRGKAIIVLNPAEPPLIMRNTVYALVSEMPRERISVAVEQMVAAVQRYVAGYQLKSDVLFDDELNKVTVLLEVAGAGDYLPRYAGNLDIMTAAAVRVGEEFALFRNGERGQSAKVTSSQARRGREAANSSSVRVIDTTLRDGSHAMGHQYSLEQIQTIVRGLDAAGVPIIEVSHGDGLGGSSLQYGMSLVDEEPCLRAAVEATTRSKVAVLLLPGIGTRVELQRAAEIGAKVARIATHCTEADIAEQHIGLAKELGLEVITFLMMAHMISPEDLAVQAVKMQEYGADVVYVVDSAGAMTPGDVRDRVRALRSRLSVDVGFHAHDNLGLGVGNTLAAIEEGATNVDGSTAGLGAGAGNAKTELLAAVLSKLGVATGIDVFKIMDVAEDLVRPIMKTVPTNNRSTMILGYAGVYSSFLLHTQRAASRFDLDPRDILVELGHRKCVGGQEDMIVDVAVELAQRRGRAPVMSRER